MIRTLKLTIAATAALTLMSAPSMAADYFAGKQITVQVPSGSGGTYHVYCQLVQRNIARFIPGNPKTVIQNMPGGGGAKSAAFMSHVAPKGRQHYCYGCTRCYHDAYGTKSAL